MRLKKTKTHDLPTAADGRSLTETRKRLISDPADRPTDGQLPADVVPVPDSGHLSDVRHHGVLARAPLDEEPATL